MDYKLLFMRKGKQTVKLEITWNHDLKKDRQSFCSQYKGHFFEVSLFCPKYSPKAIHYAHLVSILVFFHKKKRKRNKKKKDQGLIEETFIPYLGWKILS